MNLIRTICAALIACALAFSQSPFYLKNGDTVVFYGDSITEQRLYTTFAETYVITRFPQMNVRFVHSGWGGDRVSGGAGGPIDLRLQRDVFPYKPTVMTIMLGMNDGSYRAYDTKIFDTYASGYKYIIQTVKSVLPGIRITAIQPSPYDDVTKPPLFDGGYNSVLLRYSQFVKELSDTEKLTLADLNTPVVAELGKALALNPNAGDILIRDRVHPGAGGHLLMAKALLEAWNAPALVSAVELNATAGKVVRAEGTEVTNLTKEAVLAWDQADKALPMPLDLKDPGVALAVKASDVEQMLDQETLRVTGLPSKSYRLSIDGEPAGTFSAEQCNAGINLATLPTPMSRQAADVHALTLKHNNIHFMRWRSIQVPVDNDLAHKQAAMDALDQLEQDVIQRQRATAQPRTHHYELTVVE